MRTVNTFNCLLRFGATVLISCTLTSNLSAQTEKKYIRQGNKDYSGAQYSESELLYRKAIEAADPSSDAVFNLGDALYKQQKYEDASKKFNENFAATSDKTKQANSLYNLGNSLLKSQKVEESISAYKNSLKLDPSNINAKYNLSYAQDLLKQQQQQQQQQQQEENKDQDENKDDQESNQNQNQDQGDQDEQQQQQSISKEDAERLLSALANDENKLQEKVKKEKAEKGVIKTLKNW